MDAISGTARDRRWGSGMLALATLLAVGRVALGLHYPTDVLAGAVLGGGVAGLLYLPALRRPIDGLADWVPLTS
jgi:undecaprenyl-diphosphatase